VEIKMMLLLVSAETPHEELSAPVIQVTFFATTCVIKGPGIKTSTIAAKQIRGLVWHTFTQ
jgi:hypothetical protein